jgi:hypothetical protein
MSGVIQNTPTPLTSWRVCTPPPLVQDTLTGWRGGGGGVNISEDARPALYSMYVSTLCPGLTASFCPYQARGGDIHYKTRRGVWGVGGKGIWRQKEIERRRGEERRRDDKKEQEEKGERKKGNRNIRSQKGDDRKDGGKMMMERSGNGKRWLMRTLDEEKEKKMFDDKAWRKEEKVEELLFLLKIRTKDKVSLL